MLRVGRLGGGAAKEGGRPCRNRGKEVEAGVRVIGRFRIREEAWVRGAGGLGFAIG